LVIAKDLILGEIRWFDDLKKTYSSIDLSYWGNIKLKSLLRNHYRIYYEYFPLPNQIEKEPIPNLSS